MKKSIKNTKEVKHEKNEKNEKHDYPPFNSWKWVTYTTGVDADLDKFIEETKNHEFFFIGTDSKSVGKNSMFTTALVAYKKHFGGRILIHKEKTQVIESMRQRLVIEAMRSLECAWYISERINKESVISIHLDVNSNLRYESSAYKEELVGLIVSQGFQVSPKPVSWAATQIAHNRCKL